jgi:hypothetical protein
MDDSAQKDADPPVEHKEEQKPARTRRREARIQVAWPVTVDKIADRAQRMPAELERVYERVAADPTNIGRMYHARVHDVSMNGVFIEAEEPLPLLSRVGLLFDVPDYRQVEAIGWVLWRRREACMVTTEGVTLDLPAGYGVLFEWLSLEARLEIARRIARGIAD